MERTYPSKVATEESSMRPIARAIQAVPSMVIGVIETNKCNSKYIMKIAIHACIACMP
jgi:hypothetical protein